VEAKTGGFGAKRPATSSSRQFPVMSACVADDEERFLRHRILRSQARKGSLAVRGFGDFPSMGLAVEIGI
jgi:hypothetical protein